MLRSAELSAIAPVDDSIIFRINGGFEESQPLRKDTQSLLKQTSFPASSPGLQCPTSLLMRVRNLGANRLNTLLRRALFEKSECPPQLPVTFALEDSLLTHPVKS